MTNHKTILWYIIVSLILYGILNIVSVLHDLDTDKHDLHKASFVTFDEVVKSPWYEYLQHIYSDNQLRAQVPFRMDDFWIIQLKLLPSTIAFSDNLPRLPTSILTNSYYHSLFSHLDYHADSENSVIYIYQYHTIAPSIDYKFQFLNGFHDNEIIEIQRGPDVTNAFTWFYFMRGTGNWLNIGKTLVFLDHDEAFKLAQVEVAGPKETDDEQTKMGNFFRAKGIDTLQFTSRAEVIYKFEIMNLRIKQGAYEGACIPGIITRDNEPCVCNQMLEYLNCTTSEGSLPII
jgi:hypothetical protein